jgi:gluconolactonase
MSVRLCMTSLLLVALAPETPQGVSPAAQSATETSRPSSTQGSPIERLDASLDEIVSADARLETVASGFKWTEGPIWTHAGYLLFAEIPSNTIRKLGVDARTSIFMQPAGYDGTIPFDGPEPGSNGMTLDHAGRLTVAGHAGRTVWRLESLDPHGKKTTLADTYEGKALNSPNDLVYRSDGSLYFTDPPYGLRTQSDTDPAKQLQFNGVYRILHAESHRPGDPPGRAQLQLLIKDLPRPNGICFSPDEHYLYVDNSAPRKFWMRYPVHEDGTLGGGTLFFDATSDPRPGTPDGIKVDRKGNVYSTGPGGIWIFSPDGRHLGTILLPRSAGNLNWGDTDGKTLYITESDQVLRIRMKIEGVRP